MIWPAVTALMDDDAFVPVPPNPMNPDFQPEVGGPDPDPDPDPTPEPPDGGDGGDGSRKFRRRSQKEQSPSDTPEIQGDDE